MATTLDTLLVRIDADLGGLRRDLNRVQGDVSRFAARGANSMKSMESSVDKLGGSFKKLGAIVAAVLGATLVSRVVSTIRTFEDLRAQLDAISPSAQASAAAFELINRFTATTTFQLESVTQAFISLVSAGIAPTSGVLRDLGNLAAARGRDIADVAQAVQNAMVGNFQTLRGIGVLIREDGDQTIATFNGVSTAINKSNILEYLREISRVNYGDALEKSANTLTGALSNLQDGVSSLFVQIGEAGVKAALIDLVKFFNQTTSEGQTLAQVIGTVLAGAIRGLTASLRFLQENFRTLAAAAAIALSIIAAGKIIAIGQAFVTAAAGVFQLRLALIALGTALKGNPAIIAFSVGLAVLAEQTGALDAIMDKLFSRFKDDGQSTTRDIEDLNKAMAAFGAPQAAERNRQFEDTLKRLQDEVRKTELRLRGLSKDQVDAAASAGLLDRTLGQGVEVIRRLDTELRRIEVNNLNIKIKELRDEWRRTHIDITKNELDKRFEQQFSAAEVSMIRAMGIYNRLRDDFAQPIEAQIFKDVEKKVEELNREINATDSHKFVMNIVGGYKELVSEDVFSKIYRMVAEMHKQKKETEEYNEELRIGIDYVKSLATEEEKLQRIMDAVSLTKNAVSLKEYNRAMKDLEERLTMINPLFKAIEQGISSASEMMVDGLMGLFTGTERMFSSFKDTIGKIATLILREITNLFIVLPIMNALRAAFGLPIATPTPTVSFPSFGSRATGGAVSANNPVVVGERGPELFVPHSAGSIMNSNNTRSAVGGGGGIVVNQTLEITTGVVNTVRSEIVNLMPQITAATKAAVAEASMRGGSFRKALT